MEKISGTCYPHTQVITIARPSEEDVAKWNELRRFLPRAYDYIHKWGTCVDGGAFAGMWAREYAEHFGRVYAFEPIMANIECIINNAPGVTIIPCGLTNEVGYKSFQLKKGNFAHVGEGKQKMFCTTIDSFDYLDLGLIKLDVEGQEVNTLEGARKTLDKHEPVICIEVKYDGDSIRDWLKDFGYVYQDGNGLDEIWTPA